MTAAVPDPRFRDQLAEALIDARLIRWREVDMALEYIDTLMPVIAAEVEARVQAAANQRAAEELRERAALIRIRAAGEEIEGRQDAADALDEVSSWLDARAAALASPAPAPRAEEGQ